LGGVLEGVVERGERAVMGGLQRFAAVRTGDMGNKFDPSYDHKKARRRACES
jgi:hypothetical protein